MSFKKWALEQDLLEIFDKSSFMSQEPENGKWMPPLGQGQGSYQFYYSLPSDPTKTCGSKPCYYVSLSDGNISFGHYETRYGDRWEKNLEIAQGDQEGARNLGVEQINSILYAIGKYVEVDKPDQLSWSPISKSRVDSANPEARRKVYFLWSAKNLWPDYVPLDETQWMRFDKFKQYYGNLEGMPPDEEIKQMSAKKFLKMMEDFQEKKRQKDNEEWERREREEQERQRQEAAAMLSDPQYNPNGIEVGDIVINKESTGADATANPRHGRLYKVENLTKDRYGDYGRQGDLVALIRPHFEDEEHADFHHDPYYGRDAIWVSIRKIHKANDQNREMRANLGQEERERRAEEERVRQRALEQYLNNPRFNPNGVKEGDFVFVKNPSRRGSRHGTYGRITKIAIDRYGDYGGYDSEANHYGLYATVMPERDQDFDPGYSSEEQFQLKDLVKATPENARTRQYNVQQGNTSRYNPIQTPPADWQPRQAPPVPGRTDNGLPPPPRDYHVVP